MRISDWSSDLGSSDLNALRLLELQALRFRVVRCDQNDLKRAIGALGRIDQSGHVRSAAGNENGDFGFLSHHYSRESGNPFPGLASGMGFRRSAILCGAPRRAGAPAIGAAAHGAAL